MTTTNQLRTLRRIADQAGDVPLDGAEADAVRSLWRSGLVWADGANERWSLTNEGREALARAGDGCDGHARLVRLAGDGDAWLCQGCGALTDGTGHVVATADQVAEAARGVLAEIEAADR